MAEKQSKVRHTDLWSTRKVEIQTLKAQWKEGKIYKAKLKLENQAAFLQSDYCESNIGTNSKLLHCFIGIKETLESALVKTNMLSQSCNQEPADYMPLFQLRAYTGRVCTKWD